MEAKVLLSRKGINFEERMIGDGWTKEQLLEVAPRARSVPQIFEGEQLIGGYTELFNHLKLKLV
jgi:glutaredoxin